MSGKVFAEIAAKDVVECVGEDCRGIKFAFVGTFGLSNADGLVYSPSEPQNALLDPFLNGFVQFLGGFVQIQVFFRGNLTNVRLIASINGSGF